MSEVLAVSRNSVFLRKLAWLGAARAPFWVLRYSPPFVGWTAAVLSKDATVEEINDSMKEYAEGPMKGILDYSDEPLVSSDLKGDAHSSIFSALDTLVIGGNLAKVVAWYDNEWGYSMRVADVVHYLATRK